MSGAREGGLIRHNVLPIPAQPRESSRTTSRVSYLSSLWRHGGLYRLLNCRSVNGRAGRSDATAAGPRRPMNFTTRSNASDANCFFLTTGRPAGDHPNEARRNPESASAISPAGSGISAESPRTIGFPFGDINERVCSATRRVSTTATTLCARNGRSTWPIDYRRRAVKVTNETGNV